MTDFALTPADVARLLADPSEEARANTVVKVASELESEHLTSGERKLAEDIIQLLAKDAAVMVRQALVESMKNSRNLPADIAENFALDIADIALPVLQNSPMLSDVFLMQVIRERGADEQTAIAGRVGLSGQVVTSLVERGNETVVATLVNNHTAVLAEHNIAYALERFPQSELIANNLATRPAVPLQILDHLVAVASNALADKIRARPDYNKKLDEVLTDASERATLRMLGRGRPDAELEDVARQLLAGGRLTASLALRTLCQGDLRFFEICLAVAAKIPLKNAKALIHDQGQAGLQALYMRTGLSNNFLPAVRHALDVMRETPLDGAPDDVARYRKRLMERILTQPLGMTPEDINYLLEKLNDLDTVDAVA